MTRGGRLLGVVLAGGESRRFGGAKAEARIRGRSLVERAARVVAPACDEVVVGRPPDLPDLRPQRGPLGGLEAALTRAEERGFDGVVVLACDLPVVDSAALLGLVAAWRGSAEPRRALSVFDDPLQPLCGVWGTDLLEPITLALDEDRLSARAFVRDHPHTVLTPAASVAELRGLLPAQLLHNVNHPEDLETARGLVLPPIVSVVGWKNSGKTTVAVALARALIERGHEVAAAKHGHRFRLDTEGTDSWRLRHEAGARRVLLAGPDEVALMTTGTGDEASLGALVRRHLADADVVIAEGWKAEGWPAIEVRGPGGAGGGSRDRPAAADRPMNRRGAGDGPLYRPGAADADRFIAVVEAGGGAGAVEGAGAAEGEGAVEGAGALEGAGGGAMTGSAGSVLARVVAEATGPAAGPLRIDRDAPGLGETLAEWVESRVLPVVR